MEVTVPTPTSFIEFEGMEKVQDENPMDIKFCSNTLSVKKINEYDASVSSEVSSFEKLNIPYKCLNCKTQFETKYRYQRHQCSSNVENYVLKSSQESSDGDQITNEKNKCSVCPEVYANKEQLEIHQKCHNIHQCEFCFVNLPSENSLRVHNAIYCKTADCANSRIHKRKKSSRANNGYRSDIIVWKCKKCKEIFSCLQNGKHHQHFCQDVINQNIDENMEMLSTEILFQCEFCNRTFIDKSFLVEHQGNHITAKNFECVSCDKVFESYQVAVSHWTKKCSEFSNLFYLPKLTCCGYCNKTFKTHDSLYNHKSKKRHYIQKLHVANLDFEQDQFTKGNTKETLNQLIIGDILDTLQVSKNIDDENQDNNVAQFTKKEPNEDEDAPQQSLLKIRKNRKHSLKEGFKWQCEKCVKVADNIESLEAHRQNQHKSVFICSTCPEKFMSAKALLAHTRLHKNLRPHVCNICGSSYSRASNLGYHMRCHQGIKTYGCPHDGCVARYFIKAELTDHICKVHTRERPFKCNFCDKRFLTRNVYYQHRFIHTNDGRHGCDTCGKKFARAQTLKIHKRNHITPRIRNNDEQ